MTRRVMYPALASIVAILAIGFWLETGIPLRWTKGTVVADSCRSSAGEVACVVELVPDGSHVTARANAAIPGGSFVELRVWHDVPSGRDTYAIAE